MNKKNANKTATIQKKFSSNLSKTVSFLERSFDSFDKSSKKNLLLICILSVIILGIMYVFNYLTPLAADDFNYHFLYWDNCTADTRISSVHDIYTSMVYHYNNINGRILLHSIVEFFALIGKQYFNVVNSVMYLALTLLIYKHCKGAGKGNHNAILFLAINIFIWLFTSAWGQTTVWMDGSVNYLWGSVIRLAALLPYRLYCDDSCRIKNKWYTAVFMLFYSFFAGATNENTGAALIGMMFLFIVLYKFRGQKLPAWSFTGFFGALIGFAFMVLSPATFSRAEQEAADGESFISRLVNIPGLSLLKLSALAAVYVIAAYIIYVYAKKADTKKNITVSFIYIIGVFGGIYSMLFIAFFPERAWFGMTVLMITAVGNLLFQTKELSPVFRRVTAIAAMFCCLYCSMSLVLALKDSYRVHEAYTERTEYIEVQKVNGNYCLEVEKITAQNEHSPLYGVADLDMLDTEYWANQSKAAYYGLKSITAEEP